MFEKNVVQALVHLWYLRRLLILQHSNDTCLAYTLAAMSNLLSEMGIASTTSVLGSSYSPVTSTASLLSVQQRVYILLKESLRRADTLKLRRLVASNHLAMAKFELMVSPRTLTFKLSICFFCSASLIIGNLQEKKSIS